MRAISLSSDIHRDMTRKCSVMSSCFASALWSIRISRNPSLTINRLRMWSKNLWQPWSRLLSLRLNHTITTLKLVPRIDRSSPSSTSGTWFLHPRCRNKRIYHWRRGHSCFIGNLVKRKYRHPPSVAFTWSTKSGLKTSNEERERSTLLNRIIAGSSIATSHLWIKCVNRTLKW